MTRKTEDWLDTYMKYTSATEPPATYRKWVGISTIAAALQRKCWCPWTMDVLYPNMFILLVGPAGEARKGTAMGPALGLLNEVGIKLSSNASTPAALVKELRESEVSVAIDGDKYDHSSLTVFSTEFTVFLEYQNLSMLSILCDWWDCADTWQKNTIIRDMEPIYGVYVNLLAGTTPMSLQSALPSDAIGGGFTSRTIMVCARKRGQIVSPFVGRMEEYDQFKTELIYDLHHIKNLRGQFTLTEGYTKAFEAWYRKESSKPIPAEDYRFASYAARRATHMMKLSMALNASRSDKMVIEVEDFKRALSSLTAVERDMGLVFQGFGSSQNATIKRQVFQFIKEQAKARKPNANGDLYVFPQQVANAFADDLDQSDLAGVLGSLAGQGLIQIDEALKVLVYKGE